MIKADAIITADIHLRDTQPIARTDNYWEAQWKKIMFLRKLKDLHGCPILDGGDLLDTWKSSPYLLNYAIKNLPEEIITVPGNHEMPGHNLSYLDRSGLAVLESAGKITVLREKEVMSFKKFSVTGFPYGEELDPKRKATVAIVHDMFYLNKHDPNFNPAVPGGEATTLLKSLPYRLIISGHNHHPFRIVNNKLGQIWINPGSLMRMTADQIDYEPYVYLWYAEENRIEEVPVPISPGVITRTHLEKQEEKDSRLEAFVNRINDDYEVGLSFEANLEAYFKKNKTRQGVIDTIQEALNG